MTEKTPMDRLQEIIDRATGVADSARQQAERERWLKTRAECEAKGDRAGVSFCDFVLSGGGK